MLSATSFETDKETSPFSTRETVAEETLHIAAISESFAMAIE